MKIALHDKKNIVFFCTIVILVIDVAWNFMKDTFFYRFAYDEYL